MVTRIVRRESTTVPFRMLRLRTIRKKFWYKIINIIMKTEAAARCTEQTRQMVPAVIRNMLVAN